MLIAQITDMHLGFDPDNPAEFNRKRLDKVIQALNGLDRTPDLLFATGDLVEYGDVDSYRRLDRAMAACDFPVYMALGNHDIRVNFSTVFPQVPAIDGGFLQYAFDQG
ncbi:metallophosphoesterase, partial [Klebsiella pneumoniae]|uniref:metallophosphoesterase n=1 Tax=Klebsiella pneumoniae TaxID=573 RepID=UPI0037BFAAF9